jgi:hypothetical protein
LEESEGMERIMLGKVRGGRQDQWRMVWSTRGRGVLVVESAGKVEVEEEEAEEEEDRTGGVKEWQGLVRE